jgi:hypothetical protein
LHLPERLDYSMREHDEIPDAFLKKNPQLAESIVSRHLSNQMETLKKRSTGRVEPRRSLSALYSKETVTTALIRVTSRLTSGRETD